MIEAYVRSLDAAIGDRLPADVKAQRLREAEGHLRTSAAELNQSEAVRRYGPARGVANAMVRVHRGYATASTWRLSLPLVVGAILCYLIQFPLISLWIHIGETERAFVYQAWLFAALYWLQFIARVAQTRRWLVSSILVWHFGLAILATCLFHPSGVRYLLGSGFLLSMVRAGIFYLGTNALTLGVTTLADRRRVRPA